MSKEVTSKNIKLSPWEMLLLFGVPLLLLAVILLSPQKGPQEKHLKLAECLLNNGGKLEWKPGKLREAAQSIYFFGEKDQKWRHIANNCAGRKALECLRRNGGLIEKLNANLGSSVEVGFCEGMPAQIRLPQEQLWLAPIKGNKVGQGVTRE